MRNGQNKRMRGRNRKGQNPLTRVYESNGPDVKVRGTASHIADKYIQLARDSQSSGDPVAAENYYQHAEHYFRLIASVQEQFRQTQPFLRENDSRDGGYDEGDDDTQDAAAFNEPYQPIEQAQPYQPRESQPYQQREHQPREQREHQPREQREHQPREQRYGRDRGDRSERGDRDRGGERSHQPHFQPRPQPPQPQPQPQTSQPQAGDEGGDIERLPAFVTGAAPGVAVQPSHGPIGQGAPNGPNGFEGTPDRFPLHRRRRRRHGGREGGSETTEGAPRTGE